MAEKVVALGVGVSELTPSQTAEFTKVTRPVYDKWKARIGKELVDMAEAAVASAK